MEVLGEKERQRWTHTQHLGSPESIQQSACGFQNHGLTPTLTLINSP